MDRVKNIFKKLILFLKRRIANFNSSRNESSKEDEWAEEAVSALKKGIAENNQASRKDWRENLLNDFNKAILEEQEKSNKPKKCATGLDKNDKLP